MFLRPTRGRWHPSPALPRRLQRPSAPSTSRLASFATAVKSAVAPIKPSRRRNIGIIAHVDAGKTTTCERMLFYSGKTSHVGDVDKGDTVMDFMQMERERGITINAAAISFDWQGFAINLIDTPGHVDFTVEVERSIRVLDGAVAILDGVAGVQTQTETVWNQADRYRVPRLVLLNKMDREGASVDHCIESLKERLGAKPLLVQLPVGTAKRFRGAIDLVSMELLTWSEENFGANMERSPITSEDEKLFSDAAAARAKLVEQLAEIDDRMMEFYISDSNPGQNAPPDTIRAALRRATLELKGVPTFVGSSLRNKGVQPIMDAVLDYLPSPEEKPAFAATDEEDNPVDLQCDPKAPLAAQAFKVVHDENGQRLYNVNTKKMERSMRVLRVTADQYVDQKEVKAGDVGAAVGLKHTATGDSLTGEKDPRIKLQGVKVPDPVFFCSISSETQATEEKLKEALLSLQLEDPSFKWIINKDTGQWMLCGMGELHLEIIIDRLRTHYKTAFTTGPISIAYRTTIKQSVEEEYTKTYETGQSKTETATVHLKLDPLERGEGLQLNFNGDYSEFLPNNKRTRQEILEAVKEAINDAARSGIPSGFPLYDMSITLEGLSMEGQASANTFRLAALQAVWDLARQGGIQLMEPIMKVDITVDEKFFGNALSDLTSRRRGAVESIKDSIGNKKQFVAFVPLKELMGYSTELRSQTKGTGFYSMDFERYDVVGPQEQKSILNGLGFV